MLGFAKTCQVLREIEALEDRSSGGADFFMTEIDRISTHLTSREGEQLLDSQMLKVQRKTEILESHLQSSSTSISNHTINAQPHKQFELVVDVGCGDSVGACWR